MAEVTRIPLGRVRGDVGPAGTIEEATAIELPTGYAPTVTLGGTPEARTIEFGIPSGPLGPIGPQGEQGVQGEQGIQGEMGPPGADGADGTGVTILGSFPTEQDLIDTHPTGSTGDSYLINGDLFVWDDENQQWYNVGTIRGPKGEKGEPGEIPQGIPGTYALSDIGGSLQAWLDENVNGRHFDGDLRLELNGADNAENIRIHNVTFTDGLGGGLFVYSYVSTWANNVTLINIRGGAINFQQSIISGSLRVYDCYNIRAYSSVSILGSEETILSGVSLNIAANAHFNVPNANMHIRARSTLTIEALANITALSLENDGATRIEEGGGFGITEIKGLGEVTDNRVSAGRPLDTFARAADLFIHNTNPDAHPTALAAETGAEFTGFDIPIPAVPLAPLGMILQTIWNKIRQVAVALGLMFGLIERRNILRNWDFRHIASIINQRGQSVYTVTGQAMTIDGWAARNTTVEIVGGGLRLTGTTEVLFLQRIEFPGSYDGMTLTLSADINGQIVSGTGVLNWSTDTAPIDIRVDNIAIVLRAFPTGVVQVHISSTANLDFMVHRVKLELGTVSTLANDPPMDFGRELLTCMRFYEKSYPYHIAPGTATVHTALTRGIVDRNGIFASGFMFQVPKRIPPQVTIHSFRTGNINEVEPAFITTPISVTAIEGVSS
ncbi:MAG: collagen-like protein, partial [Defluviitaleaceae bacterium]|nr:collagen-like protein [Defluviitaleaceae bacterium]